MKKTSRLGIIVFIIMLFTSTVFAAYGEVGAYYKASKKLRTASLTGISREVGGAASSKITNIYVRMMVYSNGNVVGDVDKTAHNTTKVQKKFTYQVPDSTNPTTVYGNILARTRYSDDSTSEAIGETKKLNFDASITKLPSLVADDSEAKNETQIANSKNIAINSLNFIPFSDLCNIATTDVNPYATYVSALFNYLEFYIVKGDTEPSGIYVDTDTQEIYIIKTNSNLIYKYIFNSSDNKYVLDTII